MRGKYFVILVFMGRNTVKWLLETWLELTQADSKTFVSTNKEANKVIMVQQQTNAFSNYVTITEYGRGGHQAMAATSEGLVSCGAQFLLLMWTVWRERNSQDFKEKECPDLSFFSLI